MRALAARAAAGALIALAASAAVAGAQQPGSARATVSTETGRPPEVGDEIVIEIEVDHAPGAAVSFGSSPVRLDPLDPAVPEIERQGAGRTLITLRTRGFAAGSFSVAPPALSASRDGAADEIALPGPVRIEIASVLSPGDELRGNAPPQLLPGGGFAFWIAGLIALAAAFAATRLLRTALRRRPAQPTPEPADAPAGLAEIPPGAPAADVCAALSRDLRRHLAQRWQVPAESLTGAELPAALAAAGAPRASVERARSLLEQCDAVRFGGERPTTGRLRGYRELALSIIDAERG